MASDFRSLLDTPMDEIERPKPLPAGTYFGVVKTNKFDESSNKKTPYVRFSIQATAAGEDIDQNDLEGVELGKKTFNKDFYLTPEARYRLKDFLESLGISTQGRSLGECIPEALQAQVMFKLGLRPSEDGKEFFNEVKDISGVQ